MLNSEHLNKQATKASMTIFSKNITMTNKSSQIRRTVT